MHSLKTYRRDRPVPRLKYPAQINSSPWLGKPTRARRTTIRICSRRLEKLDALAEDLSTRQAGSKAEIPGSDQLSALVRQAYSGEANNNACRQRWRGHP